MKNYEVELWATEWGFFPVSLLGTDTTGVLGLKQVHKSTSNSYGREQGGSTARAKDLDLFSKRNSDIALAVADCQEL